MNDDNNQSADLAGKTCVITGGGSGIGRGTALALAAEGALVAILDLDEAGALETLRQVESAGGKGLALACNVADQASIDAAHQTIRSKLGDADVLVNNAGIIRAGGLDNLSLADWNLVVSVNLTGYFLCAQTFGRAMREKGAGSLVHVSSVAASQVTPFCGPYSVTKAGVTMLSQLLAVEWGPFGVRSNSVNPGLIYTPMSKVAYDAPGMMERRSDAVPLKRVGNPDDIAQAIVFLASPKSAYVNGAELMVDGGFSRNYMSFIPRPGLGS